MAAKSSFVAEPALHDVKGGDTSGFVSSSQAAAFRAHGGGRDFLVRTIANAVSSNQSVKSTDEIKSLLATGLRLWFYQKLRFTGFNAASGAADAAIVIAEYARLGIDKSIPCFTDLEFNPISKGGPTPADAQGYVDAGLDALEAAGIATGAYNSDSSRSLGVKVARYGYLWESGWKPIVPPPKPYAIIQAPPPSIVVAGQAFDECWTTKDASVPLPPWLALAPSGPEPTPDPSPTSSSGKNFGARVATAALAAQVPCSQSTNKDAYTECVIRPSDRAKPSYYFGNSKLSTCGIFVERCLEKAGAKDHAVVAPYTWLDGGAIVQEQIVGASHAMLERGTPTEPFKAGDCPIVDDGTGYAAHTFVVCEDAIVHADGSWTVPLLVQGGLYRGADGKVLDAVGGSSGVDRAVDVVMPIKNGKRYVGSRYVIATLRCSRATDIPDPSPAPSPDPDPNPIPDPDPTPVDPFPPPPDPAPVPEPPPPAPIPTPAPSPSPGPITTPRAGGEQTKKSVFSTIGAALAAAWAWVSQQMTEHPVAFWLAVAATIAVAILIAYFIFHKKSEQQLEK